MDTSDRIFELVDAKYKDQKDFAADIGVTPTQVSKWRGHISKSYVKYLSKIAVVLGTTTDYLVSGDGPKSRDQIVGAGAALGVAGGILGAALGAPGIAAAGLAAVGAAAGAVSSASKDSKKAEKLPDTLRPLDLGTFHRIPILGRISAGLPLYAEQHIEGYTVTDLNGGAEYFALIVRGDSMDALGIKDGYRIIVRRQEEVENGEVAVVMVGQDDATVKRFYASGSAVTLVPQSTNPEHQPQFYDTAKTPVKVIGKVIKVEFTL